MNLAYCKSQNEITKLEKNVAFDDKSKNRNFYQQQMITKGK